MSSDIFALSVSEISRQESPHVIVAGALRYVDKGLSSAISEMNSYRDLRKSSGKSRRLVGGGCHSFGSSQCFVSGDFAQIRR
jgi:hypothetical protein